MHALITGGSSGIGQACVELLAAAGHEVTFTYLRGESRARALLEKIDRERTRVGPERFFGTPVRAIQFDQGDRASFDSLLEQLVAHAPVDALIANAALGSATVEQVAQGRAAQDEALLRVNALGTLWLAEEFANRMRARGNGKIVLLSSVGGGITQFPAFRLADGMSKAAVAFLGRQLAAEHAQTGVDVFTICPGATETAMFEASTLVKLQPAAREAFVRGLPKGRLIDPAEIARLVLFLLGDEARVLHGAVLDASLGLGVHPGLITGGH